MLPRKLAEIKIDVLFQLLCLFFFTFFIVLFILVPQLKLNVAFLYFYFISNNYFITSNNLFI